MASSNDKVRKGLILMPEEGKTISACGFGVMERINVFGAILWILVLSIVLLQEEKRPGAFR